MSPAARAMPSQTRRPEDVRHRQHRLGRDLVVRRRDHVGRRDVGAELVAEAAGAAQAQGVPGAGALEAQRRRARQATSTWSLGALSASRRAVTRIMSAYSPYEITGAFLATRARSPSRSTKQVLERTSPPMPISVVADASSSSSPAMRRARGIDRSRSGGVPGEAEHLAVVHGEDHRGGGAGLAEDRRRRRASSVTEAPSPPHSTGTEAPSRPASRSASTASWGKRAAASTSAAC